MCICRKTRDGFHWRCSQRQAPRLSRFDRTNARLLQNKPGRGDRHLPFGYAAAARAAGASQPCADLPKALALAAHPNVAIKITGACTLAHDPFPYKDIWE